MEQLLRQVRTDNPDLLISEGDHFYWSPRKRQIVYSPSTQSGTPEVSLLHELAHAHLGHQTFTTDFNLLQMEVDAWAEAEKLGLKYKVRIDADYIEDCLDTYRDWLYLRSTCPRCTANGLQENSGQYRCFNCSQTWSVSSSRLCRPYRRSHKKTLPKGSSLR